MKTWLKWVIGIAILIFAYLFYTTFEFTILLHPWQTIIFTISLILIIVNFFKKDTKFLPTWLRGGIILSAIYTASVIILLRTGELSSLYTIARLNFFMDVLPINLAVFYGHNLFYEWIIFFMPGIIFYFIIGSIIGLIISKSRNKNQPRQINPITNQTQKMK